MNVALVFVVNIFKILIPTLYTIVRDCFGGVYRIWKSEGTAVVSPSTVLLLFSCRNIILTSVWGICRRIRIMMYAQ